jgi:HK97 family phage prohead protease
MKKKYTFILCDGNRENSYGFRTDLAGMDMERFKANPVMLYFHDSLEVIGRWENLRVEDGKLLADAVFDTEDETGKKIAGKVERGFLRGCSMGLRIVELGEVDGVSVASRSELVEASVCSIPSDAGAIRLYDQNHKELTFDEVRLQFNNQLKPNTMDKNEEKNTVEQQLAAKEQELATKDQEIAQLKAEIAQNKKDAVQAFLTAAVASGKIAETERADYEKLAEQDFETVKKLIDAKASKASTSLKDLAVKSSTQSERENWTYLDWMKKDSAGLARMKAENPAEFERLQKTLKSC